MKDCVLILSGGIDSTTMLYEYRSRIALALTFDYGSRHGEREQACARYHCQHLQMPHLVIPLSFMEHYFRSSLLRGGEAIPTGEYDGQNMRSTVVPFRNGIMLAIAAGIAESHDLRNVMMANHGGDHEIYPDCRPAFVTAMDSAIQAGTYAPVALLAPYTHLTKADIVARGAASGIDYSHTYSCYNGTDHHCGQCATCRERHQAFLAAGLPDPTIYDHQP